MQHKKDEITEVFTANHQLSVSDVVQIISNLVK